MTLITESYQAQVARWPEEGRHILAQFDAESIVVYQAYGASIGGFAAANGYFGGDFSLSRMSWIKPNFLWMMYRSGWGTKPNQEVVLAIRLRRAHFEEILAQAVASHFEPGLHVMPEEHRRARRAIQLGLRGEVLRRYARDWIVSIEDISAFVAEQRAHAAEPPWPRLQSPREDIYPLSDADLRRRIGLSPGDGQAAAASAD
jgi:hypothetical protein